MNTQNPMKTPHRRTGYTIDTDGRMNNYAIEPEMYINQPGDLKEKEEEEKAQRHHELEELQEDESGMLTTEHDFRHKGQGLL